MEQGQYQDVEDHVPIVSRGVQLGIHLHRHRLNDKVGEREVKYKVRKIES